MSELNIGDKVKIGATGVIGTIVLADPQGYHVEHVNDSGNLIRRIFIIEELSRADDESRNDEPANAGDAGETGNETPATIGTDASASSALSSDDAKPEDTVAAQNADAAKSEV